jgi:poly(hydroxyalkanoate) depolymerase family esterase
MNFLFFLFSVTQAVVIMATAGQFVTREISTEQGSRRYKLFIPSSYDGTKALPLVVMLHGCTQDPDDIARGTRLNEVAGQRSVFVAYPEQPATANPRKCWNWYETANQTRDVGEPALIAAITRQVMKDYKVDDHRVYVAGVSAGAAMAVIVALSYTDLYAAVGSHSGIPYAAASGIGEALAAMQGHGRDAASLASSAKAVMGRQSHAMPAIIFHGGADAVVNSSNSAQLVEQLIAAQGRSGDDKTTAVRVEKGTSTDGYHYQRTTQGTGSGAVEFWQVEELGHAWSGGSTEGTFTDKRGPDATKEMLRFFLEHPRASKTNSK